MRHASWPGRSIGSALLSVALLSGLCGFADQARAEATPATTAETAEAMQEDVATLTTRGPAGATVKRSPRGSPCIAFKPFELIPCGPMTTISLSLTPGMYGTLDQTTTRGGATAQLVDQLTAMMAATGGDTLDELARQADAVDGSSITLVIPLIDYGFTGSFGNAAISMNRAFRDQHNSVYQAIGPRDSMPGADQEFPLSGTVTIEEYSPWVLRGSFSAQMVDMAQSDLTVDDPVLTVIHQLSGRFNIIGPWRGDDRARTFPPDELERTAREDVAGLFTVGAPAVPGRGPGEPGAGAVARGAAAGTGAVQPCDCSCNWLAPQDSGELQPACEQSCAATFKACRGEPLAMISDQQLSELASLDERADAYRASFRERFEDYLEQRWAGNASSEAIIAGYLESYDGAMNLDAAVSIAGTAGMPIDCPAPLEVAERMKMAEFIHCRFLPQQQ